MLLEGRYRYVCELGRGGAGRVVAVQDVVGGGDRALKIVSAEARGMLELELDLLRQIAHPSLARVHELLLLTSATPAPFHLPAGVAVLVQERVEGRPSDEALEAFAPEEPARWRLALRAALDVASALAALHAHGVLHGDVSPANVLIRTREDEASFATLVDLGLAGPPLAADGRVRGTPGYLAPEAATGVRSVGTDLFGLGATLHRWLVGGRRRAITGDPWLGAPSLDELPPELPGALRDVVADLLACEASERPSSSGEAWESLARVADALGVARPSRSPAASTRPDVAALHAPWVGDAALIEAATLALEAPGGPPGEDVCRGVLLVSGPPSSGKTRFAREVTARLQSRRRARGEAVPTFVLAQGELPRFDARAAVVLARDVDVAELAAYVRAEALVGLERFVIGEGGPRPSERANEGLRLEGDAPPEVVLGPLDAERFAVACRAWLGDDVDVAHAARVTGRLAGRLAHHAAGLGPAADGEALVPPTRSSFRVSAALDAANDLRADHPRQPGTNFGLGALGGARAEAALLLAVAGDVLPARLGVSRATSGGDVTPPAGGAPGASSEQAAASLQSSFHRGVRDLLRAGEAYVDEELVVLREDVARAALAHASQARRVEVAAVTGAMLAHTGGASGPWTGYLAGAQGHVEEATRAFERAIDAHLAAGRTARALRLATDAHALTSAPIFVLARADALARQGRYADAVAALAGEGSRAARVRRAELARRAGMEALAEALAEACLDERGTEAAAVREHAAVHPREDDAAPGGERARAAEVREVVEAGHSRGERGEQRAAADTLGWIALGAGDVVRARRLAHAPDLRAWIALTEGDAAGARGIAADALATPAARAHRGEGAEARARAYLVLGAAEAALGALDRAGRAHHEALTLANALGDEHLAATAAANEGIVALDAGALGSGQRALREAARRYARLGRDRDLGRALLNLASAAGWVGDDVEAERLTSAAREALTRAADVIGLGRIALLELEHALRAGRRFSPPPVLSTGSLSRGPSGFRAGRERGRGTGSSGAPSFGAAEKAPPEAPSEHGAPSKAGSIPRMVAAWEPPDEPSVRARAAALLATSAPDEARRLLEGLEASPFESSPFELGLARARLALAEGDVLGARAGLDTLAAPSRWEDQLLVAQLVHDVAAAEHDRARVEAALSDMRTLLDRVSRDLDAHQRRTLRRFGPYARALATRPREASGDTRREDWRQLLTFFRELDLDAPMGDLRRRVVRGARRFLDAERAFLVRRNAGGALEVIAADGEGAPSLSVAARAIDLAAPVRAHDAMDDARWAEAKSVHALALRSVLAAPVGEESALLVDDRQRPAAFSEDDAALLVDLSALAHRSFEDTARRATDRLALRREADARRALERRVQAQAEELAARRADAERYGLVARSPAMRAFVDLLGRVAGTDAPALIVGESGAGKNHAARALHDASGRASGPFIAESCAAMPETLLESTLFGHERGAFSGATARRRGLFELADGGTLFLDDVAQMSAAMQAKLLRVVQEGEVRPLGSERSRRVDVRLVTATQVDLRERVREGRFREDLYYRLAVLVLELPPLRERMEDLPELVRALLDRHGAEGVRVAADALARLAGRRWAGNVRELETALRRALLVAEDARVLREAHFVDEDVGSLDLREHVDALERRLVREALARSGGNRTRAAEKLGLSRFGLQKKMKRLGIDDAPPKGFGAEGARSPATAPSGDGAIEKRNGE